MSASQNEATFGLQDEEGEEEEEENKENVKVMVRCKPPAKDTKLQQQQPETSHIRVDQVAKCIEIREGMTKKESRDFYFDSVFDPSSTNEQVYMKSVRQLVEFASKGYNCTVFLYGQTGTGKTYTHSSLTLSAFAHLFSLIGSSNTKTRFLIRASYYELYNEEIRDLFSKSNKNLELSESKARGVYIKDLTCFLVNNLAELEKLKKFGDKKRVTASTKMNMHSSRSHSIFSITIETIEDNNISNQQQQQQQTKKKVNEKTQVGARSSVKVGRLNLIDLAGSERQEKSGSVGTRLKEASRINLSLTCLSLVIRALTDKSSTHIPYRNSKLTRLLSNSLGGNSKTLLIACISMDKVNIEETLSTLRFASRTKKIKNKAKINENSKDALLRKYRKQIEELRMKLKEHTNNQSQQQQQQQIENNSRTKQSSSNFAYEDEAIESLKQKQRGASGSGSGNDEEKQKQEHLLQQLCLLKDKIIVGGENLLEKVEMHEKLLEASRLELEEKRLEELKLREKLESKRENIQRMKASKGSLESQVADLDEKLTQVLMIYKKTKEEHRDLMSEHESLKESLLQTIRATNKEIKYADCIIDDFIPREHLDLINAYAQHDDESDEWQIKFIALSGNNIVQTRRIAELGQQSGLVDDQIPSDSSNTSSNLQQAAYLNQRNQTNNHRQDPYIRLKDISWS